MSLIIENNVGFASPERDLEFIAIPGRDGELIIDNKRYGSVTRTIPCVLKASGKTHLQLPLRKIRFQGKERFLPVRGFQALNKSFYNRIKMKVKIIDNSRKEPLGMVILTPMLI